MKSITAFGITSQAKFDDLKLGIKYSCGLLKGMNPIRINKTNIRRIQ
jgi:hypothetical protein